MNESRISRKTVIIVVAVVALLAYAALIYLGGRLDNGLAALSNPPQETAPAGGLETTALQGSTERPDTVSSGIPTGAADPADLGRTVSNDRQPEDTTGPQSGSPGEAGRSGGQGGSESSGEFDRRGRSVAGSDPFLDPLGTGKQPDSLSERDRRRVRMAALQFVNAAYNFDGSSSDRYRRQLYTTVVQPDYDESPGADFTRSIAAQADSSGTEMSAVFEGFEIEEEASESVEGLARFKLDEGSGVRNYEQRLTIIEWDAPWKVRKAQEVKAIEEDS